MNPSCHLHLGLGKGLSSFVVPCTFQDASSAMRGHLLPVLLALMSLLPWTWREKWENVILMPRPGLPALTFPIKLWHWTMPLLAEEVFMDLMGNAQWKLELNLCFSFLSLFSLIGFWLKSFDYFLFTRTEPNMFFQRCPNHHTQIERKVLRGYEKWQRHGVYSRNKAA